MQLVIVESPAKSKTINKYLGNDYKVMASFGHIRDLPAKDGSVRPEEDFAMTYMLSDDKKKQLQAIIKEARDADALILATDPDREGEAISWHVLEALKEKKALKKSAEVKRVVFNEITKKAVLEGIAHPRELDMDLINAQQARRALDYLVGFTLSPVLWRKLPGSRSAGRVQSVALRLICERENEIERFTAEEYWTIEATFTTDAGKTFSARLTHLDSDKLEKFSITTETEAKKAVQALLQGSWKVGSLTPKTVRRNPSPPFTTSTLQQEAARKLGFGAKKTMMVAQKLYEGIELDGETTGLITYMRTDGVFVSNEAINETRRLIGSEYGEEYVPEKTRYYSSKAKNAQEAHESIRPTSLYRTPDKMARFLDGDQLKLYRLVWQRMMASQMASAVLDQLSVDIVDTKESGIFRATGSQIKFPGFYALYREGKDDEKDDDNDRILPAMDQGDALKTNTIEPNQHFTEPPPRYSEASLVKKLEELGIGRPSTYASILSVLQDRDYVKLEKKRFFPEDRGRIVNSFLELYFKRYVEYDFTADLEQQLDDISAGDVEWKAVLRQFWDAFKTTVDATMDIGPADILKAVERSLEHYIFPVREDGSDPHQCPSCESGKLHLKAGKFGAFLGCNNYPDCNYTRPLVTDGDADNGATVGDEFPKILGNDPVTGLEVSLRKGPYGIYVQREANAENKKEKPKRTGLPKGMDPAEIDLNKALALLSLPRDVGEHPETGKMIKAGIGKFGPYVVHDGTYASLSADDDVLSVGMNRAVTLIAEKAAKKGGGTKAEPLRVLGKHPDDAKEDVAIYDGRYGPYVKYKKINATIPKDIDPSSVSMQQAVEWITAKEKAPKKKPSRKKKAS